MSKLSFFIMLALAAAPFTLAFAQSKPIVKTKFDSPISKPEADALYDMTKDYFPLTMGSSWKYTLSYKVNGVKDERLPDDVVAKHVLRVNIQPDGSKSVVVDSKSTGSLPETSIAYKIFNNKVFITDYLESFISSGTDSLTPIEPILPAKLDAGAKWDWLEKAKPGELLQVARKHRYQVVENAKVVSPAGTFDCLHVSRNEGYVDANGKSASNTQSKSDYWYALGVGLIKSVVKAEYLEKTYLLQSFEVKSANDKSQLPPTKEAIEAVTKLSPTEFFPITIGSKWIYQDVLQTNDKYEILASNIFPSSDGKSAGVLFDKSSNGALMKCIPYQISNAAVEKLPTTIDHPPDFREMRLTKTMLKFPIVVGDSWEENGEFVVNNDKKVQTHSKATVASVEMLKTPAGIFLAYKIHETITEKMSSGPNSGPAQSLTIDVDTWFAPKVGMVRRFIQDGTSAGNSNSDQILQSYSIK